MSSDGAKAAGHQLRAKAKCECLQQRSMMCAGRRAAVALSRPVHSNTTGKTLINRRGGETPWGISDFKGFRGAASHCKKRCNNKQATICKHCRPVLVNNKGCTFGFNMKWIISRSGPSSTVVMWLWTSPVVTSYISRWFCHKNRPLWLMPVLKIQW